MTQALAGCAARPSPKPRGDGAAIVVEVVAKPKEGTKVHRFAKVPVYDAAPQPAPPSGQFELVDYSALDDVSVWLEPAAAGNGTPDGETTAPGEATRDGEDNAGGVTAPQPPLTVEVAGGTYP